MASNKPAEGLASVFSFAFVVYSHRKHSYYLGRELNHGLIASVISFSLMDIGVIHRRTTAQQYADRLRRTINISTVRSTIQTNSSRKRSF